MKLNKFLKKNYYKIFEHDWIVFAAFGVSLLLAIAALIVNSIQLKIALILLTDIFFIVPLVYFVFQPFNYRLVIKHLLINLNSKTISTISTTTTKKVNAKDNKSNTKNKLEHLERIVFITDIHIHQFLPSSYMKQVVSKVNRLNPDILVFGGDFIVDDMTDFGLLDILKDFDAKVKLAVLGNHDYGITGADYRHDTITPAHYKLANEMQKKIEELGIHVLRNENYLYGKEKELNIFGLDDIWAKRYDFSKYKPNKYNIIVTHNPVHFESITDRNVLLVLSGHNHGGGYVKLNKYISLHRLVALLPIENFRHFKKGFGKYIAGLYKNKSGVKMYSSTGIGLTGLGVRVNCRPEIVVIDLI